MKHNIQDIVKNWEKFTHTLVAELRSCQNSTSVIKLEGASCFIDRCRHKIISPKAAGLPEKIVVVACHPGDNHKHLLRSWKKYLSFLNNIRESDPRWKYLLNSPEWAKFAYGTDYSRDESWNISSLECPIPKPDNVGTFFDPIFRISGEYIATIPDLSIRINEGKFYKRGDSFDRVIVDYCSGNRFWDQAKEGKEGFRRNLYLVRPLSPVEMLRTGNLINDPDIISKRKDLLKILKDLEKEKCRS